MTNPRYFRNRIGFAPTTDGKVIFMVRVDGPREAWTLFTDGTQRRIETEENFENWYRRMAEDHNQPMEELPRADAERLVEQNRA